MIPRASILYKMRPGAEHFVLGIGPESSNIYVGALYIIRREITGQVIG